MIQIVWKCNGGLVQHAVSIKNGLSNRAICGVFVWLASDWHDDHDLRKCKSCVRFTAGIMPTGGEDW